MILCGYLGITIVKKNLLCVNSKNLKCIILNTYIDHRRPANKCWKVIGTLRNQGQFLSWICTCICNHDTWESYIQAALKDGLWIIICEDKDLNCRRSCNKRGKFLLQKRSCSLFFPVLTLVSGAATYKHWPLVDYFLPSHQLFFLLNFGFDHPVILNDVKLGPVFSRAAGALEGISASLSFLLQDFCYYLHSNAQVISGQRICVLHSL